MSQVSERYTSALFALALEENAVSSFKEEANLLLKIFDREIYTFLENRSIAKEDKKDLIRMATKGMNPLMVNFLCLLIDKGRVHYVHEILKELISACNKELNIQEAVVYSAKPLEEAELNQIKNAIKNKVKKEVELIERIDESLIAGFKVYVDHHIYDASFKKRMQKMKDELLKESW